MLLNYTTFNYEYLSNNIQFNIFHNKWLRFITIIKHLICKTFKYLNENLFYVGELYRK